jgi:hypothetical protein
MSGNVPPIKIPVDNFWTQSGDGNILPYIATIKMVASHSTNPNEPIQLCKGHSNQFICLKCDKFYATIASWK